MSYAPLPAQYGWLLNIQNAPAVLVEGLKLYGVKEIPGPESNSVIMGWARAAAKWVEAFYKNDDIPWCGLYVAEVCRRCGYKPVADLLSARAWAAWGLGVKRPGLGALLVFARNGGGHVGFYVGEDEACYHVLGGNQGDAVSITRILKNRLLDARRPAGTVGDMRVINLKADGVVSQNEA
jgi:uncharacterized protein (TIGR02594 family)